MESYWLFSDFYSKSCNIFFCLRFGFSRLFLFTRNRLNSLCATIHLGQSCCVLYACMHQPPPTTTYRFRIVVVIVWFCAVFFLLLLLLENSAHELVRERSHLRPRSSFPSCARFTAHLHTFNYNFISFLPFISWLNRHEERIIPCLNMSFHWIAADILLFVLIKRMKEIKKQRKRIKTGKYSLCLCLMPYDMVHS